MLLRKKHYNLDNELEGSTSIGYSCEYPIVIESKVLKNFS